RIVQVPNSASGRAHEILHRAVFEEGGLEGALPPLAAEMIGGTRRAGPDLRDVTVATVQLRQTGLGTHDAPVRVIDETMRRDITTDLAPGALIVSPHMTEDLLQGAAIEKIFQF